MILAPARVGGTGANQQCPPKFLAQDLGVGAERDRGGLSHRGAAPATLGQPLYLAAPGALVVQGGVPAHRPARGDQPALRSGQDRRHPAVGSRSCRKAADSHPGNLTS